MGKRSEFKDIAYGLIHGFVSRNNDHDGYWAVGKLHAFALQRGSAHFSLEFRPPMAELPQDDFFAVLQTRYGGWLDRQLKIHALPVELLKRAAIELDFDRNDLAMRASMQGLNGAPPLLCRAIVVDDHGRAHECEMLTMCRPHDPARERRSGRAIEQT